MENESNKIFCKVVIVGESGVGKTCIMIRFVQNTFDKNQLSTVGASYVDKILELKINDIQKIINFMIWDTTGQEKYRALTRNFYNEAKVAILVYDSTNKESFEKIKDFWFKEIKDNCPKNIILALAANKIDDYMNEQISEKEGKNFADENNMIFGCTSALSGAGVADLFEKIGYKYLNIILNEERKIQNEKNENNANIKLEDKKVKLDNTKNKKKKKKKKEFC